MTWQAFWVGAGGASATFVAVGQLVRRTADSANRYLKGEIRGQAAEQTSVLSGQLVRVEARTNLAITAAVAAAAGAGLVVVILAVRSSRQAARHLVPAGRARLGRWPV